MLRPIRSFVRREGRFTPAQQRAFRDHWGQYGIDPTASPFEPTHWFATEQPLTLEIGFGRGESLLAQALAEPKVNFIGVEVYRPGMGRLLAQLAQEEVENVRLIHADAAELLAHYFLAGSLQRLQLFFPDPWPKKRHHKRRLVQQPWLSLVHRVLVSGGLLHLATDWEEYALQMQAEIARHDGFENSYPESGFAPRPPWRPVTKFEQRGLKLGHQIYDLLATTRD